MYNSVIATNNTRGYKMKYQKTVDISKFQPQDYKALQAGQWISQCGAKGVFLGVKPSGTVVAAWYENAKRTSNYSNYIADLRRYAKGV